MPLQHKTLGHRLRTEAVYLASPEFSQSLAASLFWFGIGIVFFGRLLGLL